MFVLLKFPKENKVPSRPGTSSISKKREQTIPYVFFGMTSAIYSMGHFYLAEGSTFDMFQ